MDDKPTLTRRSFLDSLPCLAVCGSAVPVLEPWENRQQASPLSSPLSPDEERAVERSIMAGDIENYAGRGYS